MYNPAMKSVRYRVITGGRCIMIPDGDQSFSLSSFIFVTDGSSVCRELIQ